jgi:hypothetical protein
MVERAEFEVRVKQVSLQERLNRDLSVFPGLQEESQHEMLHKIIANYKVLVCSICSLLTFGK